MVLHDETVNRTTDKKGNIAELTAAELKQCNAADRFKAKSKTNQINACEFTPIPELETVIRQWHQLDSIQLEVKSTDKASLHLIAERLNFLIEAHQLQRAAIVTSSDAQLLRIIATHYRHLSRGFVAERFRRDPIGSASSLGCKFLVIDWRACSKALIENAHAAGLQVSVWTVNKVEVANKLYHWGVDSIITDEPSLMIKSLKLSDDEIF